MMHSAEALYSQLVSKSIFGVRIPDFKEIDGLKKNYILILCILIIHVYKPNTASVGNLL